MESEEAVICLNCGYNVQTRSRHETKRTVETKSGDYFQWWLPAIVCILIIFAIIGWNVLYIFVIGPAWKDDNFLDFLNSGSIKTWQAIASLFVCFFAGKFAVTRLILNPTPPEKEVDK